MLKPHINRLNDAQIEKISHFFKELQLTCQYPLQSTGGTALIVGGMVDLSAGFSPAVVLALLIVVTMMLSDAMKNTATPLLQRRSR